MNVPDSGRGPRTGRRALSASGGELNLLYVYLHVSPQANVDNWYIQANRSCSRGGEPDDRQREPHAVHRVHESSRLCIVWWRHSSPGRIHGFRQPAFLPPVPVQTICQP